MEQQIEQITDDALVNKILAGEKRLFELFIRRYNQRLFRVGMSILDNSAEAEEAMQSTYVKAYEHMAAFAGRSSFGTWLIRIMINESLAQKKKGQRFSSKTEREVENNFTMITAANILINKELNGILENAVSQLPEKYRLVFVLREIEEMSIKETAEVLDIEDSNVKVRLNRAKSMLRQQLNSYMKDQVYSFHLSRCNNMVRIVLRSLEIA